MMQLLAKENSPPPPIDAKPLKGEALRAQQRKVLKEPEFTMIKGPRH